jgi:hypothetical protein
VRHPVAERAGKFGCRFADQMGLADAREISGKTVMPPSFAAIWGALVSVR